MCRCAVDGSKTSKSGNPIFIDVLLNKLELILDQVSGYIIMCYIFVVTQMFCEAL